MRDTLVCWEESVYLGSTSIASVNLLLTLRRLSKRDRLEVTSWGEERVSWEESAYLGSTSIASVKPSTDPVQNQQEAIAVGETVRQPRRQEVP